MSHYDEVNRQQRAGEDQTERLYERRQDALRQIRIAAAACADAGEPMWGIQCPLGYIICSSISHSEQKAWDSVEFGPYADAAEHDGYRAVQITKDNAKRIEDFSDGSESSEKWVHRDDGSWEVVPV